MCLRRVLVLKSSIGVSSLENVGRIIDRLSSVLGLSRDLFRYVSSDYFLLDYWDESIINRAKYIYGLDFFSTGYIIDLSDFSRGLGEYFAVVKDIFSESRREIRTFCIIDTVNVHKELLSSVINYFQDKFGLRLNCELYDLELNLIADNNELIIFSEKNYCIGGSFFEGGERGVALISGGPDSTLATLLACREGLEIIGVYFDFGQRELREKAMSRVISTVRFIAGKWGRILKLYIVPFTDVVQEILSYADPKDFFVLLKRYMLRVAERICVKENCKVLVTGEIIGEHASQTLWNLDVITRASQTPVIRPLLTWDKTEILNYLRKLDKELYSITSSSIEPCEVARSVKPTTRAKIETIENEEKEISIKNTYIDELVEKSVKMIF